MAGRATTRSRDFLRRFAARMRGRFGDPGPSGRDPAGAAPLLHLTDPPRTFPLEGRGPWWVGRGRRAEVRLDGDPFVSRRHLRIARHGEAFTVEAAPGATNRATLDRAALPPGVAVLLAPGAELVAGKSRLVFQPAPGHGAPGRLARLP